MLRYNKYNNFSVLSNKSDKEPQQLSLIQGKENFQQSFLDISSKQMIQERPSSTQTKQDRTSLTAMIQEGTDKISLLQQQQNEIQQAIAAEQAKIRMMEQIETIIYCDTKNVKHCTCIDDDCKKSLENIVLISKNASIHNGTSYNRPSNNKKHRPIIQQPTQISISDESTKKCKRTLENSNNDSTENTHESSKKLKVSHTCETLNNGKSSEKLEISHTLHINKSTPELKKPQSGFVPEITQFDIDFYKSINTLCNDTNNFQPSEEHNKRLSQLCIKHTYDFPTMSPLIWLKSVWNVLMNSHVYNNDKKVYDDQSTRAYLIADYMIEKKLFTLWLFDGHGRILVQIFDVLQYLINKNKLDISLNDFKFYVYDIDSTVHQWHTLFFPNNVTSILGDIFDYLTPLKIPQSTITSSSLSITPSSLSITPSSSIPNNTSSTITITTSSITSKYKIPKKPRITNDYDDDDVIVKSTCKIKDKEEDKILLYLNFCGISASMENVQRLFDSDQYKHVFYSFSKRNLRPEYTKMLTNGIEISQRQLFCTYLKKCK